MAQGSGAHGALEDHLDLVPIIHRRAHIHHSRFRRSDTPSDPDRHQPHMWSSSSYKQVKHSNTINKK